MNKCGRQGAYLDADYESKARFVSYWYQIDAIMAFEPRRILEVGVGSGFVSTYLKRRGLDVVTVDVDGALGPDITACVTAVPLPGDSFDVVACYEVLEHLSYEDFGPALGELRRLTRRYILLSLPDSSSFVKLSLQFSQRAAIHRLLSYPRMTGRALHYEGEHHWEIGRGGYPLKRISGDIFAAGLVTSKTYRLFEHPYHRFFILEK
jgi:SAM-dependent methyltransferase